VKFGDPGAQVSGSERAQLKFRKCRLSPTCSEPCLSKIDVELGQVPVTEIEEEYEYYKFTIGRFQCSYTNFGDLWA